LVLTLLGAGLVVFVHSLSIGFLYPAIGNGFYFFVLGVAGALAVAIGRAVRWMNSR
jgi:hypothetical protein